MNIQQACKNFILKLSVIGEMLPKILGGYFCAAPRICLLVIFALSCKNPAALLLSVTNVLD